MTILGKDITTGELVRIDEVARSRGIYVIGTTGTGKTTLLQSIAFQDMKAGHGVCVLDPHGDMIDWLLERVPGDREKDAILLDPSDIDYPFGINLLECNRDDPKEVMWVIANFSSALGRMFSYSWGPRLEYVLNLALHTVMKVEGSTTIELLQLLIDRSYRKNVLEHIRDTDLLSYWNSFPKNIDKEIDFVSSTVNKLTPFILNTQMRNIVGQSKSSIKMREIMDERKILLINLSKGDLGENNSSLLGSFIINMILIAAMSRRDMTYYERLEKPFHVIVDEYQNFASESFSVLQSEARKYAVDLVVAHQFRDQLTDENKGAALNVGNFVSFRVTGADGIEISTQFDNTPPEPEKVWEPIRLPSQQYDGLWERGVMDRQVLGHQRMYSDVRMQTANDLANIIPFRAKAKIIEKHPKKKRPVLNEYVIDTVNPDEKGADKFYGFAIPAKAERIKMQSQNMEDVKSREEVEAEIEKRHKKVTEETTNRPAETHEKIKNP